MQLTKHLLTPSASRKARSNRANFAKWLESPVGILTASLLFWLAAFAYCDGARWLVRTFAA